MISIISKKCHVSEYKVPLLSRYGSLIVFSDKDDTCNCFRPFTSEYKVDYKHEFKSAPHLSHN